LTLRSGASALVVAAMLACAPTLVSAQETANRNVISANPFGLLLELFNAEYERVVSETATAGFGGSFFENDGDDYLNADVFYRIYPSGEPLDGWAFGAKVGITKVDTSLAGDEAGTYFGFGFDTNWSWLLGQNDNFYVGVGFGLKRLLGTSDASFDLKFIPTFRIVNVGIAF
jgi:hypothetical protein